jgi:hypothetical protein
MAMAACCYRNRAAHFFQRRCRLSRLAFPLARSDNVTCLDDFSAGDPDNIASFVSHPTFLLVIANVSQPPSRRSKPGWSAPSTGSKTT